MECMQDWYAHVSVYSMDSNGEGSFSYIYVGWSGGLWVGSMDADVSSLS